MSLVLSFMIITLDLIYKNSIYLIYISNYQDSGKIIDIINYIPTIVILLHSSNRNSIIYMCTLFQARKIVFIKKNRCQYMSATYLIFM